MKVWLTRKHAEVIDGVDLSTRQVGDVLDLPPAEAHLLLAEKWAAIDRRVRDDPVALARRASDRERGAAATGPDIQARARGRKMEC